MCQLSCPYPDGHSDITPQSRVPSSRQKPRSPSALSAPGAPEAESIPTSPSPADVECGAWALGHKLCSIMVKQEQSPELPVDPLAASSAMAAAAMATPPLLGLSPISRLPIPHQVSLETIDRGRGRETEGSDTRCLGLPRSRAP